MRVMKKGRCYSPTRTRCRSLRTNATSRSATSAKPAPPSNRSPSAGPRRKAAMSERSLNDAALCEFGKHWELDGDYIRCAECGRPQLASYAYKTFPHRSGCDAAGKVDEHPWHALRGLLRPIASPAASDSRVPDGYVRVPIDPTSAMVGSAHCVDTCHGSWPREAWRAMLAAAPAPAAAPGSEPTAETP